MKTRLFLALGLTLALSSCSTITHTVQTAPVNTEVYSLTVADMDVSEQKQTATAEWKWNPFNMLSLKGVKDDATAKLLAGADADVLVDPQFTVERRGLFRGGSVTVAGFPATYKNFRNMTEEDARKIATVEGKLDIAIVSPFINTSASLSQKKKTGKRQISVPRSDNKADLWKGKSAIGINIGYGFFLEENDYSTTELGLKYQYNFAKPFRLEAYFNYGFGRNNERHGFSEKRDFATYGVNMHYIFGRSNSFRFYPLVGIGGASIKSTVDVGYREHRESANRFTLSAGAGAECSLSSKFSLGLEIKYQTLIGPEDANRLPILVGATYKF